MLKIRALTHYNKMIRWAEKQSKRKRADCDVMLDEIGEHWHGDFRPYCERMGLKFCENGCPLYGKEKTAGGEHCCNGLWQSMNQSKTWGTRTKRAKKVREYIESHG